MNKLFDLPQLVQLVSGHFKEIIREPAVIFWGVIFPILMALGLGVAFTRQADIVRHVAVIDAGRPGQEAHASTIQAVLEQRGKRIDRDQGEPPRYQIARTDEKLGTTVFIFETTSWKEALVLLKRGNIGIIMAEENGRIRFHFDPLNTDAHFSYLRLSQIFGGDAAPLAEDPESVRPMTVPGTRYIDFLVPGLMAMSIMMSCMWGMSYGMIDKRSKKLLRRMVATPMRKSYFLISLMTVRFVMNLIETSLLFLAAWIAFDITIQGGIPGLFAVFLAGNIAFGGIAVFISCRTANTEIGNGLVNAVVMPMMVLSGVFFSYHNFPDWSIPFIQKLPLTLLADGLRGIFIEGAGFSEALVPAAILSGIGIFFFSVGLRFFRWH